MKITVEEQQWRSEAARIKRITRDVATKGFKKPQKQKHAGFKDMRSIIKRSPIVATATNEREIKIRKLPPGDSLPTC